MDPASVTAILDRVAVGDADAADELYRLVYADLRGRARGMLMGSENNTLQATALVHEAWLRVQQHERNLENRAHFLGFAAKAMRSVLVDHARERASLKRGGAHERVVIDEALEVYNERAMDVVALNDALERLAALDERMAKIVELRFFGGLSIEETAHVLDVGHATVERGWTSARAWLRAHLNDGEGASS